MSVFENGRLVNLAEDSRFEFASTSEGGEMSFDKRSDAEGYLQSLHSKCYPACDGYNSEEDFVRLTPETTEAQMKYWNLIGCADESAEFSSWDSLADPLYRSYW